MNVSKVYITRSSGFNLYLDDCLMYCKSVFWIINKDDQNFVLKVYVDHCDPCFNGPVILKTIKDY